MLPSDRLVLERQPVPGRLLPPPRDREIVRGYAYRVTFCDHDQLAALSDSSSTGRWPTWPRSVRCRWRR